MNYKPGICTFCGTGCGHLLQVEDNQAKGVFVSRNHPVSTGRLCVRGWHVHELLRTGERITGPMKRENGELKEIPYDEALSLMVTRLKGTVAPDEIAFLGSPRSSNEENFLFMKLARTVFKTNNISLESDSGHRSAMNVLSTGTGWAGMLGSLEEIEMAEFILVVGTEITRQNPIIGSEIHKAALNGSFLATISSRKSRIAKLSSAHLQVNPGTKKLLIGGIAKAIIEENLHDTEYIRLHTEGFEGFANSLGSVDDRAIAEKTGIPSGTIREMARRLASAKSAMVFFPTGVSGLDEDTISYIYNLFLVAGKVGGEGCGVNPITGICNLQGGYDMGLAPDLLTGFQTITDSAAAEKFDARWNTELNRVPGKSVDELLADTSSNLKHLVVVDHDDGVIRHAERLKELEFIVYFGAFQNPFTEYADLIIPIASYIETDGTMTNTERRVQLATKKTEPVDGVMPAWRVYSAIAEQASVKWNYSSPEEVMKEIAELTPAYAGITYDLAGRVGGVQWPCGDKNPEGTSRFDLEGSTPLKFVSVTGNFPEYAATDQYPFLLLTGKAEHFWHQNNLMKRTFIPRREYNAVLLLYPEGFVEISEEDAKKIGVRDRWTVRVVSEKGSMDVMVMVSGDVPGSTAYIPYFIRDMVPEFLMEHGEIVSPGEDAIIPVRLEKV